MKFIKVFLAILLLVGVLVKADAQSARVEKVWLEHNSDNGNGPLKVHVKFHTEGMKGKEGHVCVYFYHGESKLVDKDGECCTTDGQVAIHESITPIYENSLYEDFCLTIKGPELHIPTSYVDEYSLRVRIYYPAQEEFLASSELVKFYAGLQDKICIVCKGTRLCFMCYGMGLTGMYPYQVLCPTCKGGKYCPGCRGAGMHEVSYTYSSRPNTTGPLNYNGGTGYNDIQPLPNNTGSNNIYKSGNSSAIRRICPGCSGTGKGSERIEYAPNYTGSSNSRYCSKCNRTMSAHTHIQGTCTVCRGKGYVD